MKEFKLYEKGEPLNKINHEILTALSQIAIDFDNKKEMTEKVKICLVNLGHFNNYKVYARVFSDERYKEETIKEKIKFYSDNKKFVNKEWLYDIHWYTDVDKENSNNFQNSMPKTFELACECEWSKNKATSWNQNIKDIGYDFQKLLFSNAKLNLFICRVTKETQLKDLYNYISNAIKNYENLKIRNFLTVSFLNSKMYFNYIVKK